MLDLDLFEKSSIIQFYWLAFSGLTVDLSNKGMRRPAPVQGEFIGSIEALEGSPGPLSDQPRQEDYGRERHWNGAHTLMNVDMLLSMIYQSCLQPCTSTSRSNSLLY